MAKSIDTYNCCLFLKLSCLNQTLQAFCLFVSCLLQFGLLNQKPASLPINDSCTLHATRFFVASLPINDNCMFHATSFRPVSVIPITVSASFENPEGKIRQVAGTPTMCNAQLRANPVSARKGARELGDGGGSVVSTRSVDVRRQRGQYSIPGCTKAAWSALDPKQFMHPLPSERGSAPESLKNQIKSSAQLEASESDAAADDL